MSFPFVALVEDDTVFNPQTHARWDLYPLSLSIRQSESQLADLELVVRRPVGGLSAIANRRVIVSMSGKLLFDGVLSMMPQGIIGEDVTLKAVAKPIKQEDLDRQLAVLADLLKTAPHWEPLCVPAGKENDWAELLAARTQVLNYSRNRGAPFMTNALGGTAVIRVYPFDGSVSYESEPGVAQIYGVRLEAKWKQIVLQTITDNGAFRDFRTMTPDGIIEGFPKVGTPIGDGFNVIESRARMNIRRGKPIIEKSVAVLVPVDADELDPAFIEEGEQILKGDVVKLDARLRVRYIDQIPRTEHVEISTPALVQKPALLQSEDWEDLPLRDLTEVAQAQPWQPNTFYPTGYFVAEADKIYSARVDHTSGDERELGNWVQIGDSRYVTSRAIATFFKTDRGATVLEHALLRMKARATMDARQVKVSFEAAMPAKPWEVSFNTYSMTSERLPGGFAKGRLVEYALTWNNGERLFSGKIACVPGTNSNIEAPAVGPVTGLVPVARGRMSVDVEMAADEQERELLSGAVLILPTVVRIKTTPVPSSGFEQTLNVPISRPFSFPQDVLI